MTGSYKIGFDAGRTDYLGEWFDDRPDFDSAISVNVSAAATATVNAVLARGGVITGKVTGIMERVCPIFRCNSTTGHHSG